jgi:hypothetical protein
MIIHADVSNNSMNDYQTIFEYEPSGNILILLIPILLFLVGGLGIVFYVKRALKNYSLLRQIMLFIGYFISVFAAIVLIISLVKAPQMLSRERNFKNLIESKKYLTTEGEIKDFSPISENGHNKESFSVNGIRFEYSDNVVIKGFHQTSRNNGPLTRNGQKVRIAYIIADNINLIQKIEIKE